MKSKVRDIIVDSESYVWGVSEEDWHNVRIKVWKGGNKRIPWFEILKEFDDPWLNFSELSNGDLKSSVEGSTPVTPGLIAAYIQEVNKQRWVVESKKPIYLKTNKSGGLEKAQ